MNKCLGDNCLSLDLNTAPIHDSGDPQARKIELEGDPPDESKLFAKEDQSGHLFDQLNRMKSENKKLTEMLFLVCANYNVLQNHMMQKSPGSEELETSKKRKFEAENSLSTFGNDASNDSMCADGSPKRPKEIRTSISRVLFKTDPTEKSLAVRDGYHWRKYGQKVTKNNPSPRAYFKCSFAPTCEVKKKVQRSIGDPSILVATYEGEHNHQHPLQADMLAASPQGANCCDFSGSKTIHLTDINNNSQISFPAIQTNAVQKMMVEQMASSLTRNPSFTAALLTAISGRILSHEPAEK